MPPWPRVKPLHRRRLAALGLCGFALSLSTLQAQPETSAREAAQTGSVNPASRATKGPAPAWVEILPVPLDADIDPDELEGGEAFLLVNSQEKPDAQTAFYHYAKTFVTRAGVQDGSDLSFNFDPTYQTFTFNLLRLHRDGQTRDLLPGHRLQFYKVEDGREREMFDGRYAVTVVLEDIRVGDTIEYAFTIQGYNPVYQGRYANVLSLRYGVPVARLDRRLLWPNNGPALTWKHFGTDLQPAIDESGPYTEYRWQDQDVPSIRLDSDVPGYHDPFGHVVLTEFTGWDDLVQRELQLFAIPDAMPSSLQSEVDRLRALDTPEEQILGALRFVQDEIRYVGVFIGPHSHQPYPLETVMRRRFGDCKDKALMLTTMLRDLGFEAHVALVDTDLQHVIGDWPPTPFAFDHCITALDHNGRTYWLDGTRSLQRGRLDALYAESFGYALVVRPGEAALTPVEPAGHEHCLVDLTERFTFPDYSGKATLDVVTRYYGVEADYMRDYVRGTSRREIENDYLNYYASTFPSIELAAPLHIEDLETRNVLTVTEQYSLEDLWYRPRGAGGRGYRTFYANSIDNQIIVPSTRLRTMPLALDHPDHWKQTFELVFPDNADGFVEEDFSIDDPHFAYDFKVRRRDEQTLAITHTYRSLSDAVAPERFKRYLANVSEVEDSLGYEVRVGANVSAAAIGSGAGSGNDTAPSPAATDASSEAEPNPQSDGPASPVPVAAPLPYFLQADYILGAVQVGLALWLGSLVLAVLLTWLAVRSVWKNRLKDLGWSNSLQTATAPNAASSPALKEGPPPPPPPRIPTDTPAQDTQRPF
ncbi:MAG: DUF3857 domain-containing protein [Opitutales bacterium]